MQNITTNNGIIKVNSQRIPKHFYNNIFVHAEIQRSDDNNIVLNFDSDDFFMSDTKCIGRRFKQAILNYFSSSFPNNNDVIFNCSYELVNQFSNKRENISFDISMKELVCLHAILSHHNLKSLIKKYGEKLINELIGTPLNPFEIEQIRIFKEEIKQLKIQEEKEISKIEHEYRNLFAEITNKYENKEEKLHQECINAVKKIEDKYYQLICNQNYTK